MLHGSHLSSGVTGEYLGSLSISNIEAMRASGRSSNCVRRMAISTVAAIPQAGDGSYAVMLQLQLLSNVGQHQRESVCSFTCCQQVQSQIAGLCTSTYPASVYADSAQAHCGWHRFSTRRTPDILYDISWGDIWLEHALSNVIYQCGRRIMLVRVVYHVSRVQYIGHARYDISSHSCQDIDIAITISTLHGSISVNSRPKLGLTTASLQTLIRSGRAVTPAQSRFVHASVGLQLKPNSPAHACGSCTLLHARPVGNYVQSRRAGAMGSQWGVLCTAMATRVAYDPRRILAQPLRLLQKAAVVGITQPLFAALGTNAHDVARAAQPWPQTAFIS